MRTLVRLEVVCGLLPSFALAPKHKRRVERNWREREKKRKRVEHSVNLSPHPSTLGNKDGWAYKETRMMRILCRERERVCLDTVDAKGMPWNAYKPAENKESRGELLFDLLSGSLVSKVYSREGRERWLLERRGKWRRWCKAIE